jgi:hypothetical protein
MTHILEETQNEIESCIRNIRHMIQGLTWLCIGKENYWKTNKIIAYLLEDVPRHYATGWEAGVRRNGAKGGNGGGAEVSRVVL